MSTWNIFLIFQMQLNRSLDFLEKKVCSVKSTRSLSFLVAAAETRLQELNQLSAEIMNTGLPEKINLSRRQLQTSQYASYNYRVTSKITIHYHKTTHNLSATSREDTRNQTTRTPTLPVIKSRQSSSRNMLFNSSRSTSRNKPTDTTLRLILRIQLLTTYSEHSQPNLSSAKTHNYFGSNEQLTNRQDVFTKRRQLRTWKNLTRRQQFLPKKYLLDCDIYLTTRSWVLTSRER